GHGRTYFNIIVCNGSLSFVNSFIMWKHLLKCKSRQLLIPVLKEFYLQKWKCIIEILLHVTDQPIEYNTQMHRKMFTKQNLNFHQHSLNRVHSKIGSCKLPGNDQDKMRQ